MMRSLYRCILFVFLAIGIWRCDRSDIMYYEGGNAIHFMKSKQGLSFMANMDAEKDTIQIQILVTGNPVNQDREFEIEILNDSITTANPEYYKIISAIVPANDTCGYLFIEVMNPSFLNIEEKTLALHIAVKENEYFKPGGWLSYITMTVSWTTELVQPETWRAMRYFFTSKYSSNVYRAIIASTGLLEFWYYDPDPETGYQLDQYEGWVYGKMFGDWIREYNATHEDVYRHDDGDYAGEEIVPIY